MQIIADLQLHSKYSRAVSQKMDLIEIAIWASKKGLGLMATGDWQHPLYFREITANLKEVNPGIYVFKSSWLWQNIDAITKDNAQGEYYLTDMVELAIRQGLPIYSLAISPEEVFGINTKSHLEEAKRLLVK